YTIVINFSVNNDHIWCCTTTDAELRSSFEEACAKPPPPGAPAGRPRKVNVSSGPLAKRLRGILGANVRVAMGRVPDVDHAFAALSQHLSDSAPSGPAEEFMALGEEVRAELTPIAKQWYDEAPWCVLAPHVLLRVRIPSLNFEEGRVSIMGHGGETFGFMLFNSHADALLFQRLALLPPSLNAGDMVPKCFSLNIDSVPLIGPPGQGPTEAMIPLLTVFEHGTQRPTSPSESKLVMTVAAAMTRFIRRRRRELLAGRARDGGVKGRYTPEVMGSKTPVHLMAWDMD
ncbi:MAG: hypothetical protein AAGN82_31815, partial [Myxococcota bacterium]